MTLGFLPLTCQLLPFSGGVSRPTGHSQLGFPNHSIPLARTLWAPSLPQYGRVCARRPPQLYSSFIILPRLVKKSDWTPAWL